MLALLLPGLLLSIVVSLTIGFANVPTVMQGAELNSSPRVLSLAPDAGVSVTDKFQIFTGLEQVEIVGIKSSCPCLKFRVKLPLRIERLATEELVFDISSDDLPADAKYTFAVSFITRKHVYEHAVKVCVDPNNFTTQ